MNPKKGQRVFIIDNADNFASKNNMWKIVSSYYGVDKAKILMPTTYVLIEDMNKLQQEYDPKKLYIMKKNIQRQEGLKIVDSLEEIKKSSNDYVIVQELLQDPYLIDGRKINMRFYVLVVCNENSIDVYVFNNGFMYYTKEPFRKNSLDFGPNITTGYIDRSVYEKNPLTHDDFRKYLLKHGVNEKIVFLRIYVLLATIVVPLCNHVCKNAKLKQALTFQLFGADIALNDKLEPMLMEFNKGPDMGSKDKRDGDVKRKCINDMLTIVGLTKNSNNGFIQVCAIGAG
jgi:hypothetical protein